MPHDFDTIVVGAGLAGASAAAALSVHGISVAILEARNRPGGRGFARPFGVSGETLDFGGSWITPWQHRIRGLCHEHGVELRPRHPVSERRWYYDGALHRDGPTSTADRAGHEHAMALMAAHSALLKAGLIHNQHGTSFADVSFAGYLRMIGAPEATRDLASAWWTVSGNGDKTRVPASEFLRSIGCFDGTPDGMCEVWADTLVGGVQALTTRMIETCAATFIHGASVCRVAHDGNGVQITLAGGRNLRSTTAIVAAGLNPMAAIEFAPPLPPDKSASIAAGHLGRAVKIWAKVEGIPIGVLATGGGHAIEWMFSERHAADSAALVVGFGVAADGWQPRIPQDAEDAVQRFFPEGRLVAADWHDWNADPCSRGAWVASILGNPQVHMASTWSAHGPLAFASSDFASAEAGWFEAAIISGEAAAHDIARYLGKS